MLVATHLYRVALATAVLVLSTSSVQAADLNLTCADSQRSDHPVVKALEYMSSVMYDRTGNVKIVIRANGELGGETETLAKVRKGELDMARLNLAMFADSSRTAKILTLPFLFRSKDQLWKTLQGELGKRIETEVGASGLVAIGLLDSGFRSFYSNKKPIRSLNDFAGLRVRIQASPVYEDLIRELGATPIPLNFGQTLEAFKNGTIDAAENNIINYVSAEHHRYAKYLSLDEHEMVPEIIVMSKKAWSALPPATQALLKVSASVANDHLRDVWEEKEAELLTIAQKAGVTVTPKKQLSMTGIEGLAFKIYNKHLQTPTDLDTVLKIASTR